MSQKNRQVTFHGWLIAVLLIFNIAVMRTAYTEDSNYYWVLFFSAPLLLYVIRSAQRNEDASDGNQPPGYSG